MQKCGNCGHENRAGVVFCENCGASLIGKQPLSTKALETTAGNQAGASAAQSPLSVIVQEMAIFKPGDVLKLSVEGTTKPIELQPKGEVILGRRDPATGATPDVDLTPFAGYRMGVSRRHAAIRQGDDNTLNVWDLGSSNGTFLNGQRLNAHRPYPLRDGDELRLGQMVIRVNFKPAPVAAPEPTPAPLPSTRPLRPLPEAAAPAAQPLTPPKPAPETTGAAAPPSAPVTPAPPEKPAPSAAPSGPVAAEEPQPAVSAPEAVPDRAAAPSGEPPTPSAPAAIEQATSSASAPEPVAPATEQVAPPTPETAAPAATETASAEVEKKPTPSAAPPAPSQEEQGKAAPPAATEQKAEPKAGENNVTTPEP